MKISELIALIDTVKPNAYPADLKVAWLNEVEGMVWTDIMLLSPLEFKAYSYNANTGEGDSDLLVAIPHSKLYNVYLAAMIDFYNGEYDRYHNTITLFNAYFSEFSRWYAMHYRPADGEYSYMGMYISAYGIAVKHGFVGTEEEWLESLKAGGTNIDPEIISAAITEALSEAKESGEFDGRDGTDGVGIREVKQTTASTVSGGENVVTVYLTDGTSYTFTFYNGAKGADGSGGGGGTGTDGVGISSAEINGNGELVLHLTNGNEINVGRVVGADGKTPVKGTDYWTASDKFEIMSDVLAALPTWNGGSY